MLSIYLESFSIFSQLGNRAKNRSMAQNPVSRNLEGTRGQSWVLTDYRWMLCWRTSADVKIKIIQICLKLSICFFVHYWKAGVGTGADGTGVKSLKPVANWLAIQLSVIEFLALIVYWKWFTVFMDRVKMERERFSDSDVKLELSIVLVYQMSAFAADRHLCFKGKCTIFVISNLPCLLRNASVKMEKCTFKTCVANDPRTMCQVTLFILVRKTTFESVAKEPCLCCCVCKGYDDCDLSTWILNPTNKVWRGESTEP